MPLLSLRQETLQYCSHDLPALPFSLTPSYTLASHPQTGLETQLAWYTWFYICNICRNLTFCTAAQKRTGGVSDSHLRRYVTLIITKRDIPWTDPKEWMRRGGAYKKPAAIYSGLSLWRQAIANCPVLREAWRILSLQRQSHRKDMVVYDAKMRQK